MSDIVERLRNLEQWIRNPEGQNFTLSSDLFDEAADEIERLHAENRQLRKALGKITTLHWFAVPAEIARAALGEGKK
jgi:DNA mismatch repair ATPase MutS